MEINTSHKIRTRGQRGTQRHATCSRKESEQRPGEVVIEKEKRENYISVGIIRVRGSRQMEGAENVREQNIRNMPRVKSRKSKRCHKEQFFITTAATKGKRNRVEGQEGKWQLGLREIGSY